MLDAQQLLKIVESGTALFGPAAVLLKVYVMQLQPLAVVILAAELKLYTACLFVSSTAAHPDQTLITQNSNQCLYQPALTTQTGCDYAPDFCEQSSLISACLHQDEWQ